MISFGQTSPLKKDVGVKLKSFFYYKRERERERERESEFTGEKGLLMSNEQVAMSNDKRRPSFIANCSFLIAN